MSNQSEHHEQCALMQWVNLNTGKYPQLKWLFAVPNGGHRHIAVAAKLKREGVKSGVPDLFLPVPNRSHIGLVIEMKTKRGKLSDNQRIWLSALNSFGWKTSVCRGWEQAKNELELYLGQE